MASASSGNNLLAFAGAQGFGAHADGGRGGKIVKVTNLNDSGQGSLRWALEDLDGPRIVVFEVGGQINLRDQIQINGDVTVAGQTAPGGITITGGRLRVVDSDVIIRGLHVRPGDGSGQQGSDRDGISVGKRGSKVEDVIVDSNSITWSVDELASTWGGPSNVTFSNNIMAQALRDSIHPKGDHSMGVLIGDGSARVTVTGNLIAHNEYRNATVKDDSKQVEFVNNLIYNYGPNGFLGHEGVTAHIIGNVYIRGADSAGRAPIRLESPEGSTAYYLNDNVGDVSGAAMSKIRSGPVFQSSNVDVMPSSQVAGSVLNNAGARAQGLDPVDRRIIDSVKGRNGEIVDSVREAGGYSRKGGGRQSDRDGDGIPDRYEAIVGSDPARWDAHGDANRDGYSNIENYINGLIDGFGPTPRSSTSSSNSSGGSSSQSTAPAEKTPARPAAPESNDGGASSGSANPIRYEAESFGKSSGFWTEANGAASGGKLMGTVSYGQQRATKTFDGPSGTYDVRVRYFDENDGKAKLAVSVDGRQIDSWTWNKSLAGNAATSKTATSRLIEDVRIDKGDSIVLAGARHRDELLRIDAVEFVRSGGAREEGEETPARPTVTAEKGSGQSGSGQSGSGRAVSDKPLPKPLNLEAEEFRFVEGFRVDRNPHASGDKLIRADGKGVQKATTVFDGPSGQYDIRVSYFDESDGASDLAVAVDGAEVAAWAWNQRLGDKIASSKTLTTRTIEDVRIDEGEAILLTGYADGGEPLRIDAVELIADLVFA